MLVAVLQKDAQSPAFLVSVDLDKRQLTIRAVAAEPEPGKSYELWLVHDELKTPRSLGLIGDRPFTVVADARGLFAERHRGRDAGRQPRARGRLTDRRAHRAGAVRRQAHRDNRIVRAGETRRGCAPYLAHRPANRGCLDRRTTHAQRNQEHVSVFRRRRYRGARIWRRARHPLVRREDRDGRRRADVSHRRTSSRTPYTRRITRRSSPQ